MWHILTRAGVSTKLTIVTFTLMVVSLVVLTSAIYRTSTSVVQESQYDLMRNVMTRTDRTLVLFQEQVNTLLLAVGGDERLWTGSDEEAERILTRYASYNSYLDRLYIRRDSGVVIGIPTPIVRTLGKHVSRSIDTFDSRQQQGIWWTAPYKSPMSNWTVTVGMRALGRDGVSHGVVAVDVPLLRLNHALSHVSLRQPSTMFVVTGATTPVIADPGSRLLRYRLLTNRLDVEPALLHAIATNPAGSIREVQIAGQSFLLMTGATNRFGWRTEVLYSSDELARATRLLGRTSLILVILVTIFSLGLAWFIAHHFAAPLERLAREMARVRLGQLQGVYVPKRKDEIGQLAAAFDGMMSRIRELIRDLQDAEKKKNEAEIRSLQSQIEPHFLYNTLNAIGHSAALGRTDDVYTMIQSLTRLLSFSLDKVKDKVTLAEEIEHLNHYIRLQRIRYGNAFSVTYDVAPGAGSCEVLKLTLQPLVENAIFHGLAKRCEGGLLHIAVRLQRDRLELQISDNGPGIPRERLRSLEAAQPEDAEHVGLRNVGGRLRLHYGDQASLRIESSDGTGVGPTGTTVVVTLPARTLPQDSRVAADGHEAPVCRS